jgi:hypothetical protein
MVVITNSDYGQYEDQKYRWSVNLGGNGWTLLTSSLSPVFVSLLTILYTLLYFIPSPKLEKD